MIIIMKMLVGQTVNNICVGLLLLDYYSWHVSSLKPRACWEGANFTELTTQNRNYSSTNDYNIYNASDCVGI